MSSPRIVLASVGGESLEPPAADNQEEAERALERLDCRRKCGLSHVAGACGAYEMSLAGERSQVLQLAEYHRWRIVEPVGR